MLNQAEGRAYCYNDEELGSFRQHHSGQPDEDNGSEDSDLELDPLENLTSKPWEPPHQTKDVLQKYVKRHLDKSERQRVLERFPIPSLNVVKCPVLDTPMQQLLTQKKYGIKNVPGALALKAIQSRMLDSLGPLSALHAAAIKATEAKEMLHPKSVQ
ncbi:unnamed protein product [Orchesella dallaii]|uniref:Uncharacterized protein n=1 Tax=Orchesella dallaii TaxID=48710 RepID=A0ABP1S1J3_9HEXA